MIHRTRKRGTIILVNYWWQLLLIVIISYFTGNFCGAVIVSKKLIRKDIRTLGSNNAGTTNMTRVFGVKYGALTLLIDLLKALICVLASREVMRAIGGVEAGLLGGYLAGLAVILGHNYPVLLGLRGGKGFASGIGVMLALQPLVTLVILLCGIILLLLADRMSVFAMAFFAAEAVCSWIITPGADWWIPAFTSVYLLLAVIAHWPNILRLAHGEEKPLGLARRMGIRRG